MEISKINEARDLDSAVCQIDDPRTGEYAFSIVIAGPTHPASRAHAESEGRGLAHQGKRLGSMQKAMDARTETILTDSDLAVSKQIRTLIARTLDWADVTDDGKPVPYDPKQMEQWYAQAWLRDTVFAFMNEPRNFVIGSSKTSSPTLRTSSN